MKILNCKQGGAAWLKARCGRPTASRFSDLVTPTGRPVIGKARRSYMLELCGERLTGKAQDHFVSAAMERGTILEPRALAYHNLQTGKEARIVGFVLDDSLRWGCSPDALLEGGGVEAKCPGPVELLNMIDSHEPEPDYMMQMQGCMWVCQVPVWDFVVFTDEPGLPCDTWQVEADPDIHAAFDSVLPAFCDELDAMEARMRARGGGTENTAELARAITDEMLPDWMRAEETANEQQKGG